MEQNTTMQLTLEQKIGQILCPGFDGTALNAELRVLVTELQVGGLVYFERNVASRTALAQFRPTSRRWPRPMACRNYS